MTTAPVHLVPFMLNKVVSLMNQDWMDQLRPHGLTIPRWQVLSILSQQDGSRATEIADLAGTEQSVMSRVLMQMERDGLVERRPDPTDGRATLIHVTGHGKATFNALLPAASRFVEGLLEPLGPEEAATLAALLDRLVGARTTAERVTP